MNNVFDSLKLTLFEIVGYVLPGVFLEIAICLFQPLGIANFSNHLPVLLLLSYPLGQILHSISNILDLNLYGLAWKIYHLIKEKDENGHGVKDPRSRLGRLARALRCLIEKHTPKQKKVDIDQMLKKRFCLENMNGFESFFLKESILAESSNIATNFEHLHYQKIFNKSVAFIFACLTLFIPVAPLLGLTTLYLSDTKFIKINENVLLLTAASAITFKIFYKRAIFFKSYRNKIMDSAVRMYLHKNLNIKSRRNEKLKK